MIEELIKFLGGSALLLAAIGWIIRSLITHRLTKDVDDFKVKLQHESELELQKASHDLRVSGLEYEHGIALLQQKRAEVIAELYKLLINFVRAADSYASYIEWTNEPSKDEKRILLGEKASEFSDYYTINKIYFSRNVCDSIDGLWSEVSRPMLDYSFWRKLGKESKDGATKEHEAWKKASSTMTETIPPILVEIENEFRELLGVAREKI